MEKDVNRLCLSCFQYGLNADGVCSLCGKDNTKNQQSPHHLPFRSVLGGKYLSGKILGEGGFGITYLGWDINLETIVAIKEYFPIGAAFRNASTSDEVYTVEGNTKEHFYAGRDRFIDEARRLAKLNALPGIVSVKDFFQENGTAYIVMDYIEGITLKQYLEQNGGRLPVNQALALFQPLIQSMREIHAAGIIHRDISPDNIMVSPQGHLYLIDFGAARDYEESDLSLSIVLKPGYAPEEQYRRRGQGPWTDVYALCATLYRTIEGVKPPDALERVIDDTLQGFSVPIDKHISDAILKGLSIRKEDRFQNFEELYHALQNEPQRAKNAAGNSAQVKKPAKKNIWWKLIPAIIAIAAVVFIAINANTADPQSTGKKTPNSYLNDVLAYYQSLAPSLPSPTITPPAQTTPASDEANAAVPAVAMKIVSVSAGSGHSMALDNQGRLWVWGDNYFGQIGDGNITTYHDPTYEESEDYEDELIMGPQIKNIDHDVFAPKVIMENIKEAYAYDDSSFAITNDGELYAWGRNTEGQLGDQTMVNKLVPTYIMPEVAYVYSHWAITFIVKEDNSLWITGTGMNSSDDIENYGTPFLFRENVKKAVYDGATINNGILFLTTENKVFTYSPDSLNSTAYRFSEVKGLRDIVDIAAAGQIVYALDSGGNVYGWGPNGFDGSLGTKSDAFWVREPVLISKNIKKLLYGRVFITNDDALLVWGSTSEIVDYRAANGNDMGGEIGDALITYESAPVDLLMDVHMASESNAHYIALGNDGSVYTWGANTYGQLGDGKTANRTEPQTIEFVDPSA